MLKRPLSVTILAAAVLTLAALYLTRLEASLRQWEFLQQYALPGAAWYLSASGLLWGLLWLWLASRLWRGSRGTPQTMRRLSLLYAAVQWAERLYLRAHNPLFWLLLTLLGLAWVFGTLARPEAQLFFGELHEQEPKN